MGAIPDKRNHTTNVPSIADSEELLAKDAPAAVAYLQRRNIDDLYEALGLKNYVGTNNA